jgi:hypothetical protein
MTVERRYDDDEMGRIFRLATEARDSDPSTAASGGAGAGLTLAELQAIGVEAGIEPERVSRAAALLEVTAPTPPVVRQFGVPVSTGHAVDLPSPLTDPEWDRLVVHLRDTFRARGRVSREGSLRSWTNGNLHVLLEPTAGGYRLRMRSLSSDLRGRLGAGVGLMAMGAVGLLVMVLKGALGDAGPLAGLLFVEALGVGFLLSGIAGASRWTALRSSQFRDIGATALRMVSERSGPLQPARDPDPEG